MIAITKLRGLAEGEPGMAALTQEEAAELLAALSDQDISVAVRTPSGLSEPTRLSLATSPHSIRYSGADGEGWLRVDIEERRFVLTFLAIPFSTSVDVLRRWADFWEGESMVEQPPVLEPAETTP